MAVFEVKEDSSFDAFERCLELAKNHYYEVESLSETIPFNPDVEMFKQLVELNLMTIVTITMDDELVGYIANLVSKGFMTSLLESREVGMYLSPKARGTSAFYRALKLMESLMEAKGVSIQFISFKAGYDYGLAERLGYTKSETSYQKIRGR